MPGSKDEIQDALNDKKIDNQISPTPKQEQILRNFQLAYAQKYWDAGNLTTTLLYGLTFSIFLLLSTNCNFRGIVQKEYMLFVFAAIGGHVGIITLTIRMFVRENEIIVDAVGNRTVMRSAIRAARNLRIGAIAINFALYVGVLSAVKSLHTPCPGWWQNFIG